MTTFQTMDFTPSADGTLDNMKYGGIDVSEIVQELKDNCDDAGAKNVAIYILPKDKDDQKLNELVILDDGRGMIETNLWNAMILAKRHDHTTDDIGKFGVGLKNATMGLGDQICIVTKTAATSAIGVLLNVQDMRRTNSFKPTQYEPDAATLRGQFPSTIWTAFAESMSGTMISVKSIHEHHIQDVKSLVQEIHRALNFNYVTSEATSAAETGSKAQTVVRSDVSPGKADLVVEQVDAFYRADPSALAYVSETELRVYPSGRGSAVYEVLTGQRYRGCNKGRKPKTLIISGTPEKPVLYQMHAFPKGARADTPAVHSAVESLPSTPYKTMKVRFVEVTPEAYEKEGTTGAWDGFDMRRRGFFFRRGARVVGACMALEEKMDDWSNRYRMEICFPPSLDMEMGLRTQKQMSKNLHSAAISDALRILWRQQVMELIRLRKKDLAESDASSVSSAEKPVAKAPVKSANILTQLAEIEAQKQAEVIQTSTQDQSETDDVNTYVQVAETQPETPNEASLEASLEAPAQTQPETQPETVDNYDDMKSVQSEADETPLHEMKVIDKYVQLVTNQGTTVVSRVPGGTAASHLREWLSSEIPLPLGKTKEDLFKHMAGFWNMF